MRKKTIVLTMLFVLLALPVTGLAFVVPGQPGNTEQPINPTFIIFKVMLTFVWPIVGGVVIVLFIVTGFLFLTAEGDPAKLETARKALIWSIIGVVVILLGSFIIETVKYYLGIT